MYNFIYVGIQVRSTSLSPRKISMIDPRQRLHFSGGTDDHTLYRMPKPAAVIDTFQYR